MEKKALILSCCLTVLFSFPVTQVAWGQEESLDDLLSLDIESLADVEISVASKQSEKISDAPGIVTVVTRKEIEQYGGINLLDIFNRIPGMQVAGSVFLPTNVVSMRGQSNQHYANRILFLINGRPFRDSTAGGWNSPLFTQFPLNNIEQIEIIRGPGSVLYGTNAFSGVVNIITRKADNEDPVEASVTYGSFNHRQFQGRAAYAGEDWSVVAALNKLESDGDTISFTDELGTHDSLKLGEGGHGLSLLANVGNLTVQGFSGHIGRPALGARQNFPFEKLDNVRHFVNAGYKQDLWGDWTAEANIGYNRMEYLAVQTDTISHDDTVLGEVTLQGPISDTVNLIVGGTFEHFDGAVATTFQDHWNSQYAQLEWKPSDWLKLVGGMQRNDSENFKVGYSPRAAAIFTPHEHWGAKILYGEAFRAASATEAFLTIENVLTADTTIQPETIATLEGQIFYQSAATNASVSVYRSRIEDIIGRVANPNAPPPLLITNTGEQTFKGVELEGKKALGGGWSLQGSAGYQYGESDTGIDDPTFYPNWMAKIGVIYEADSWSLGMFKSTYGTPEDIRNTDPTVAEVNPQPESYSLLSANLNVDVNEVAGLRQSPEIIFTLYGENLLDEDVYFPDFNRQNVNSFPIESGRAVFGRLTVKF